MSLMTRAFDSPVLIFGIACLLRVALLAWGQYQDSHSAIKYTDIDYYVFTDAARSVYNGESPYERATYRYTPLLAWALIPTAWSGPGGLWFLFGKALFALCDLVVGWDIYELLKLQGLSQRRSLEYASVWLLNPMVANISTRGSSEALLCGLIMAILYTFEHGQIYLTGTLLGIAVHLKVYPFIYGVTLLWSLKSSPQKSSNFADIDLKRIPNTVANLFNEARLAVMLTALCSFVALNAIMYKIYGQPFLEHSYIYHFTRTDHRHNYSIYNILLYLTSAHTGRNSMLAPEKLAFLPQILLSTIVLPLLPVTHISIATTMLAQTLAFVTFNKVCTAQYFLWYLVFLPLYLPHSSLIKRPRKGLLVLGAWVGSQALWLSQAYNLEFLGRSVFVGGLSRFGLWEATIIFFLVNCYILSIIVADGMEMARDTSIQLRSKEHDQ